MTRILLAFVAAAVTTTLLCSLVSTSSVLNNLSQLGITIDTQTALSMLIQDLGISTTLGPIIAVSFLLAFLLTGAILKWSNVSRTLLYMLAGFSSIVCALLILQAVFQLMPVAGARTLVGLMFMGMAGLIGAWVFSKLTKPQRH